MEKHTLEKIHRLQEKKNQIEEEIQSLYKEHYKKYEK